jgi:hypothetical protein
MEALTAVQVALLTIYDMCKAVDRGMVITDVKLLEKHGGKSGQLGDCSLIFVRTPHRSPSGWSFWAAAASAVNAPSIWLSTLHHLPHDLGAEAACEQKAHVFGVGLGVHRRGAKFLAPDFLGPAQFAVLEARQRLGHHLA